MKKNIRLIKVGIIGCGNVTERRHLPMLMKIPNVRVVAVADQDPQRLEKIRTHFNIQKGQLDYRALLEDPTIDAIAICVPAKDHIKLAIPSLMANSFVFIEKPLALSLEEADQLMQLAKNSSKKVMVGFNMRWHRLICQARKMIQQQILGSIRFMLTRFTTSNRYSTHAQEWKKSREQGGGALIEMAVHHFDLWRFLLQSEVEEVFATSIPGEWDDEIAMVTARMNNGILVSSAFSETTGASQELELYGEKGHLRVSCYRFDGLKFIPSAHLSGDMADRMKNVTSWIRGLPQLSLNIISGGDYPMSFLKEWKHFIHAILNNAPLESTLEDGYRSLQIVLASLASASIRKPVKIEQSPQTISPVEPTLG